MNASRKVRMAAMTLVAAGSLMVAAPAFASGGSTGVRNAGACSQQSTWTLKAKPDDARIEVEFQVDSNKAGQSWTVKLADNGTRFFSGTRTTQAPSGSFTVRKLTADRA